MDRISYWPISVVSTESPFGFKASTRAFLPSTLTTTKFSVLSTFWVIPAGGVSTAYSDAPPPPVMYHGRETESYKPVTARKIYSRAGLRQGENIRLTKCFSKLLQDREPIVTAPARS